jgi:Holliday junction resolvasome RuvABC endonuclease subunit
MRILAVDAATATGWAVSLDGVVESGVEDFGLRRGESPGMRFLRFRIWLERLVDDTRPQVIVYEQAHHRGGAPTEVGVGLATRVLEVAAAKGVECCSIHTSTLKVHATGKGNADKSAMQAAARARFAHYDPERDPGADEADSLLMVAWGLAGFPQAARKARKRKARAA